MITSVTLDDALAQPVVIHDGNTRRLTSVTGLLGVGPLRENVRVRPQVHGAINDTRFQDGQPISLEGLVIGTSDQAALTSFRTISGAALQTLDSAPAALKWTDAGGLALQRAVKLAGPLEPVLDPMPRIIRYQLQLLAEDPRAYSQALTTATGGTLSVSSGGLVFPRTLPIMFAASAGGTVAVNNQGNRLTSPILRIYGACENPQLLLVGSSSRLVISGTIAAGDYLELDVARRTAKMNGASNALSLVDPASSAWFDLPVGTSTIQLLSVSFDTVARCDVLYRHAYT